MKIKYSILPPKARQVMRLWNKGYSYEEIAKKTKKKKITIGAIVHQSIEKMKKFDYTSRKYNELVNDRAQLMNLGFNLRSSSQEVKVLRYWKVLGLLDADIRRLCGIKQRQLGIYKSRIRGRINFEVFERDDADYSVWKRHTNYATYDLDLSRDEEGNILFETE